MKAKQSESRINEQDTFEMIELASAELEVMARAFKLIAEICAEDTNDEPAVEAGESR